MTTRPKATSVIALAVDEVHVIFPCPVCRTRYKKDGSPYASSKPVIHRHGTGGDISDGRYLVSHHYNHKYSSWLKDIHIFVTSDTKRCDTSTIR